MLEQLNIYGRDKVEQAIKRLRDYEPEDGYYLAFSGGKDSVTIKALADMAGVKYDAHYQVTSIDPPELVQFVKTFDDVSMDIPRDKDGKAWTMWRLIVEKRIPPTRVARYCCLYLKEHGGTGRFKVTGVRHAESTKRKNRGGCRIINITPGQVCGLRSRYRPGGGQEGNRRQEGPHPQSNHRLEHRGCMAIHKGAWSPLLLSV